MSINLLRNVKVFLTSNLDSTNKVRLGNEFNTVTKTISSATHNGTDTITFTFSAPHGLTVVTSDITTYRYLFSVSGFVNSFFNSSTGFAIKSIPTATTITVTKLGTAQTTTGTGTAAFAYNHTNKITQEVFITDNFSFTQTTNVETVSPNETGDAPLRGERQFNSSINPIEFTFSTYIRPSLGATSLIYADESFLWNALSSKNAKDNYWLSFATGTVTSFAVNSSGSLVLTVPNTVATTDIGKVVTITGLYVGDGSGITADQVKEWMAPAKVVSSTATTITLDYLNQPANSSTGAALSGTLSNLTGSTITLRTSGWCTGKTLSSCSFAGSDVLQLQSFGIIAGMDNLTYAFDGCVLDSATVDFAMDSVAKVTWTGKALRVRQFEAEVIDDSDPTDKIFGGNFYGTIARANSTAGYIANKLSTILLRKNISGYNSGNTPVSYYTPITSGSITISNNIQSVTPNTLYEVNRPIAFFTGNRSIAGSFTVYLRSGSTSTGSLHSSLLVDELFGQNTGTPLVDPKHYLELQIGGSTAGTKVHFDMRAVSLKVPEITTDQILSINVGFKAQGSKAIHTANADYDISVGNELAVRYYAA